MPCAQHFARFAFAVCMHGIERFGALRQGVLRFVGQATQCLCFVLCIEHLQILLDDIARIVTETGIFCRTSDESTPDNA